MTGADALHGLCDSLNRFGDNVWEALTGDTSLRSPVRVTTAVRHANQETELTKTERIAFVNALTRNVHLADAYLQYIGDKSDDRLDWVRTCI
jgi:hypothetical protein